MVIVDNSFPLIVITKSFKDFNFSKKDQNDSWRFVIEEVNKHKRNTFLCGSEVGIGKRVVVISETCAHPAPKILGGACGGERSRSRSSQ